MNEPVNIEIPNPPYPDINSFLTASPFQQHEAWFRWDEEEESRNKPYEDKLNVLRDRLENAKPRSQEKADIIKEKEEIQNQIYAIRGIFLDKWLENELKMRDDLGEYIKSRYRGSEDAICEVLDEFYETVSDGRYFENCTDRWFKHPSREVLESALEDTVTSGDLKPIISRPVIPQELAPSQLTLW